MTQTYIIANVGYVVSVGTVGADLRVCPNIHPSSGEQLSMIEQLSMGEHPTMIEHAILVNTPFGGERTVWG